MSDCGCSSSDGNCTDNLDSNAKNAQLTGNINYDGSAITCSNDASIDVSTGDGLNTILGKMLAKICDRGGSRLIISERNKFFNTAGTGISLSSYDFGTKGINKGDVIKFDLAGYYGPQALATSLMVKFLIIETATGNIVTDRTIAARTFSSAGAGEPFFLNGSVVLDKSNFNFSYNSTSQITNNFDYQSQSFSNSLDFYGPLYHAKILIDVNKGSNTNGGNNLFYVNTCSVEHLK